MSQKLYNIHEHHYFLVNANLNKSLYQVLHLNALYPLAFVPSKKYVRCLSFSSFLFSGHVTYQIWS